MLQLLFKSYYSNKPHYYYDPPSNLLLMCFHYTCDYPKHLTTPPLSIPPPSTSVLGDLLFIPPPSNSILGDLPNLPTTSSSFPTSPSPVNPSPLDDVPICYSIGNIANIRAPKVNVLFAVVHLEGAIIDGGPGVNILHESTCIKVGLPLMVATICSTPGKSEYCLASQISEGRSSYHQWPSLHHDICCHGLATCQILTLFYSGVLGYGLLRWFTIGVWIVF